MSIGPFGTLAQHLAVLITAFPQPSQGQQAVCQPQPCIGVVGSEVESAAKTFSGLCVFRLCRLNHAEIVKPFERAGIERERAPVSHLRRCILLVGLQNLAQLAVGCSVFRVLLRLVVRLLYLIANQRRTAGEDQVYQFWIRASPFSGTLRLRDQSRRHSTSDYPE